MELSSRNNSFTHNGRWRLERGQRKLTLESLEEKYAKEIAAAQPYQKEQIYQRMASALARLKNYKPSVYTLW